MPRVLHNSLWKRAYLTSVLALTWSSGKAIAHSSARQPTVKKSVHVHSKWSLDLGASLTKSTSTNSADSGNSAAQSDDHSNHGGLRLLSEGADHSDGEGSDGSGSGTAGAAFDPMFTIRTQYNSSALLGFIGLASYGYGGGIVDPEIGATSFYRLSKIVSNQTSLTVAYPASEYSQKNFKLTTMKISSGPTWNLGRYYLGLQAIAAYAWYKKTVIYRTVDDEETGLRLQEGDYGEVIGPIDDNLAASDREFQRIGPRFSAGYRLSSRIKLDSSLGIFKISHQFGGDSWLSQFTVLQLSYIFKSVSTYASFLLSEESSGPKIPSQTAVSIGIA